MMDNISFKGYTLVACGTLRRELNYLRKTGFLNADKVLFTTPGLHEHLDELERQLRKQLSTAMKNSKKIIVVYGSKCYLDPTNPKDIDQIIQSVGSDIQRVNATTCIDMLADTDERSKVAGEKNICWLPLGWVEFQKVVFKDWDAGMANETFPKHDKALMLDGLDAFEEYSIETPEKILEFSDWMGIPLEPHNISLDRFKNLLSSCIKKSEI
jgi:hypothetical protein